MSTCSGRAKSSVLISCIVSKPPLLHVFGPGASFRLQDLLKYWLAVDTYSNNEGTPVTIELDMQGKEQRYLSMHSNYSKPCNRSLNFTFSSEIYVLHWEGTVRLPGYVFIASGPPQANCMCFELL